MIEYTKTQRGDILRLVKPALNGSFGKPGDLVRVIDRTKEGVMTENMHGVRCEFVFNCGAEHLEPTEWRNDFPAPVVMGVDLASGPDIHFEGPLIQN